MWVVCKSKVGVRGHGFVVLLAPGCSSTSIRAGRRVHRSELGYLVDGSEELNGPLGEIGSNMPFSLLPSTSGEGSKDAVCLLDQSITFPV